MTRFVLVCLSALFAVDAVAADAVSLAELGAAPEAYAKKDVQTDASFMMVATQTAVSHCKKKQRALTIRPPLINGSRGSVHMAPFAACVTPEVAAGFAGKSAGTPISVMGKVRLEKVSGVVSLIVFDDADIEVKPAPPAEEATTLD